MPAERKKKGKKRGITREQIWKIWDTVQPRDWYEFFNAYKRESKVEFAGDTTLKAICPHPKHDDTTASFFVFTAKGYAKCFGCEYYTSNPIELLALLMDGTDADAVQLLNERFSLNFLPRKAIEELRAQKTNQQTKQAIMRVCNQVMCDAIADPTKYPFATKAVDWLIKDRQVPVDVIHALPVGVMPPLVELGNLVAADYKKAKAAWDSDTKRSPSPPEDITDNSINYLTDAFSAQFTVGGVVWPLHATPTEIARLKIRGPNNNNPKDIVMPLDEFEDLLGMYGLGWKPYQQLLDPKTMSEWAYLTEGEMDVMTYMARALKRGSPYIPLFSVGGKGGSAHIEPIFKAAGLSGAYMIGDSPNKGASGGDVVVRNWMTKIRNTRVKVFTGWDAFVPAGDLDEAVLQHGIEKVEEQLWKNVEATFIPAWQWAAELASHAIEALSDKDYRVMIEVAALFGGCLKHRHDIEKYATELSNIYEEITVPILKREIASSEDTETGFILRCTDALKDHFATIATKIEGGNRWLLVYAKDAREYRKIKLDSEQSIAQELAPTTGNLLQFVRNQVGFPAFLDDPEDMEGQGRRRADTNVRYYLKEACLDMANGVPDLTSTSTLRQGYHTVKKDDGTMREYIVCGKDVVHLDRTDKGDAIYKPLDGPSHDGILFDLGLTNPQEDTRPWYPGGLSSKILESAKDIDLQVLFGELEHFFDIGFEFATHEIMKTLLAAQTLIFPVMNAFDRQMLMFITGETSSGKSTLMSTFCGTWSPNLRLVLCSQGHDNYTAAGIIAATHCDSRLLCLDEFEFDGNKSDAVRVIMEVIRGLVTEQAQRVTALKDGKGSRVTQHRLPIILSGITGAERPQDLNRLLMVEMKKVKARNSPENILMKEFGQQKIADMARQIAVALYPRVPAILEHYQEIKKQFVELNALLPFQVEWRYASALFGAMALLKYLGHDWQAFFREFVTRNATTIHRASTINESSGLLNAMFNHGALFMFDEKRKVSVSTLLGQSGTRNEVNSHSCGVYFDENTKSVMILLGQAMPVLIPPNHPMRNATEVRVRDTLERHRMALTPPEIQNSGMIQRAAPFMGANISVEDVVAFKAKPWLNEGSQDIDQSTPEQPAEEVEEQLEEYDDWG
jgi:hypothetical protein